MKVVLVAVVVRVPTAQVGMAEYGVSLESMADNPLEQEAVLRQFKQVVDQSLQALSAKRVLLAPAGSVPGS